MLIKSDHQLKELGTFLISFHFNRKGGGGEGDHDLLRKNVEKVKSLK